MWSSFGVAGMRQRWASRESDPGRTARSSRGGSAEGAMNGQSAGREIMREFMAKPIVIDCAYRGCEGKYLMGEREIDPQAGTGARVVLHCTRNPEEHDSTITVEPLSEEAVDRLGSALSRGEPLHCAHCRTEMQVAPAEIEAALGSQTESEPRHYCSWCGVRWRTPTGLKATVA